MEPQQVVGTREGSLGGHSVAMSIDTTALAHLMGVMTNLYSDPYGAIIREYSTNAWDAHVEAGNTMLPIKITTPTSMSPYFVVKDQGVGMDQDDIVRVYSKYGASTKRGDNTQTGMLGLGGKSALAVTNQFTVTGVKGGVRTIISVSRVEDGTGSMEIVDERPTSEPNGVEISIPIRGDASFNDKVTNFFRFWKPGQVEVNGKEPEFAGGQDIGDNLFLVKGLQGDRVVMGGVAYPVKEGLFEENRYNTNFGIVAYVEIGDVHFVPSREELNMGDQRTQATLRRLRDTFKVNVRTVITNDIDNAPNHSTALSRYLVWKAMFLHSGMLSGITYKGESIPQNWKGNFYVYKPKGNGYYRRTKGYTSTNLTHDDLTSGTIIRNFTPNAVTTTHKRKAVLWAEQKGLTVDVFTFATGDPGKPWLDTETVDWDEIHAVKLPSTAIGGPRAKRVYTWDVLDDKGYMIHINNLDAKKPVYYYSPAEKNYDNARDSLTDALKDGTIACIGQNRWKRFLREYPKAIHVRTALITKRDQAYKALTADDLRFLGVQSWTKNRLKWLDPTRIDDPEAVKFVEWIKAGTSSPEATEWLKVVSWSRDIHTGGLPIIRETADPVSTSYPLLNSGHRDDTYIYMNAKFASKKGN